MSNGINVPPGVSTVTGSAEDDVICGNRYKNTISAGAGDDMINGGAGNDALNGGDGNDTLNGGDGVDAFYLTEPGNDSFNGGAPAVTDSSNIPADTLVIGNTSAANVMVPFLKHSLIAYTPTRTGITIDLSTGSFDGSAHGWGMFTFEGIENVLGGVGDDTISGDARGNRIAGWVGADTIDGKAGNDRLDGRHGTDNLTGGAGVPTPL